MSICPSHPEKRGKRAGKGKELFSRSRSVCLTSAQSQPPSTHPCAPQQTFPLPHANHPPLITMPTLLPTAPSITARSAEAVMSDSAVACLGGGFGVEFLVDSREHPQLLQGSASAARCMLNSCLSGNESYSTLRALSTYYVISFYQLNLG